MATERTIRLRLSRLAWCVLGSFALASVASAATSFTFSVPEGQGGSSNEFYRGRCVRAYVVLDTDGNDTGGADLVIDYDDTAIQIVQSNCATAASTIYPGSQYDNYTNNTVTSSQIKLGAYNNPGNAYNGSGMFASFYFTVLSDAGSYDLEYDFTPGITTDCNLAEYGTGDDILDQADDHTLSLVADADTPTLSNQNPAPGATDVQVISNVAMRMNDGDAGVDIDNASVTVAGTTYTNGGANQFSDSCHTTNQNRVDYCDVTVNPAANLDYDTTYVVDVTADDLGVPTVHTLTTSYSFTTEDDDDAPSVYNQNPASGAGGVSTATDITLNIRDVASPGGYNGLGVDLSTVQITVTASGWGTQVYQDGDPEVTVTGTQYDYHIVIDPASDFLENTSVTVQVVADDLHAAPANHLTTSYAFTTADTVAPTCTDFVPDQNATGAGDEVSFHCTDTGTGVDIDNLSVVVDGVTYASTGSPSFTYTGDSSDYEITITPATSFAEDYAFEVIINARDLAGNTMDQESYGLTTCGAGSGSGDGTGSACTRTSGGGGSYLPPSPSPTLALCPPAPTCPTIVVCPEPAAGRTGAVPVTATPEAAEPETVEAVTLQRINSYDIGGVVSADVKVVDEVIVLEGTATPFARVTLLIRSEPILITVIADANGEWRVEMENIFREGTHEIYAVSVDDDGTIEQQALLTEFEIVHPDDGFSWAWLVIIGLASLNLLQYGTHITRKREATT